MFNSDIFANRPAAEIAGRIFISTDTFTIYRDTGSTWDTIGGGGGTISGSIAAGQVAFGSALNTIAGTNNLFWNNTNARLGVGTNTPQTNIQISDNKNGITSLQISNTTAGNVSQSGIRLDSDASSGTMNLGKYSSTSLTYLSILATDGYLSNANFGDITLQNEVATGRIKFSAGAASTPQMTLFSTGNLGIGGGLIDSGQRLQVYGDTLLRGSGNSSATTALNVQNSASSNLFRILNDGTHKIGNENIDIFPTANGSTVSVNGRGLIISTNATSQQGVGALKVIGNSTSGLGNDYGFWVSHSFTNGTGGTATHSGILLNQTINQTGGANGITRGLYVNPTLTAAADFRAIEWSNNSGWGLYGLGTAPNYFAGNVQIGSTTAIGSTINLQVTGIAHILDTRTYTSGTIQSFVVQKNTTINSVISASSGICNYVSTGDNGISSSQSVPASTSFANIYAFNKYQFNSAGLTLTQTQGSPGVRSISQLFTQNVFKGSNNGTITHMSGIQIGGYYNDNTGTITPVITNAYQLLINDTGAYGHTFTLTNRWGIYQEGINDRNYLAGNLLLNSTTDTGQILQINGAIRVNGQSSGTAGGNSGQHLIINVDGTQYKINLLNP